LQEVSEVLNSDKGSKFFELLLFMGLLQIRRLGNMENIHHDLVVKGTHFCVENVLLN